MPARSGKSREQRLRRKKRTEWQLILGKATSDIHKLHQMMQEGGTFAGQEMWQIKITKHFRSGGLLSAPTDEVMHLILKIKSEIFPLMDPPSGPRLTFSREHLAQAFDGPALQRSLEKLKGINDYLDDQLKLLSGTSKCTQVLYIARFKLMNDEVTPHAVRVQSHWLRLLVLPWRRRRDIMQCLSDESSDVVDALISDPWLTDHVYVNGELDERRLVDLAGIIRQSGAAMARSKVLRRICASCGRCHAVVREKAFPVCSCGGPHYCSVACQTAHWEAHHARQCGKNKKSREGDHVVTPRFCFTLPDGHIVDLYEIGKRNQQRDADAADAAVAAAVAAAAMRALSPGVVSD